MSYPVETWVLTHAQQHRLHLLWRSPQQRALTNVPPLHHAADKALSHTGLPGSGAWNMWGRAAWQGPVALLQIPQQARLKSVDKELTHRLDSKDPTRLPYSVPRQHLE